MNPGRQIDMADPVQAAVKIATIESAMTNIQTRVSEGFMTVGSRLDSMQADQREAARAQGEVATQLRDLQTHSDGLNRLATAIERQAVEFASWRDKHENENRAVADSVTRFNGWVRGFGVLGMLVAGGAWAWVSARFEQVESRRAEDTVAQTRDLGRLEVKVSGDVGRVESKFDKEMQEVRADISEIRKFRGLK